MDDRVQVTLVGIDKGISDKWRISILIPTIKQAGGGGEGGSGSGGGGEGGEDQGGYTTVVIDAPSFFEGINMLNASVPRRISFMQAQAIVFSDELAKSGLIKEYIAPLSRFREIRKTAHVFVTKGKAYEFIKENKLL